MLGGLPTLWAARSEGAVDGDVMGWAGALDCVMLCCVMLCWDHLMGVDNRGRREVMPRADVDVLKAHRIASPIHRRSPCPCPCPLRTDG